MSFSLLQHYYLCLLEYPSFFPFSVSTLEKQKLLPCCFQAFSCCCFIVYIYLFLCIDQESFCVFFCILIFEYLSLAIFSFKMCHLLFCDNYNQIYSGSHSLDKHERYRCFACPCYTVTVAFFYSLFFSLIPIIRSDSTCLLPKYCIQLLIFLLLS